MAKRRLNIHQVETRLRRACDLLNEITERLPSDASIDLRKELRFALNAGGQAWKNALDQARKDPKAAAFYA